jgi:predicted SAM-dependent methyltransferase
MTKDIFKSKTGIHLDIGCGENKQPNFIGMDIRSVKGVDIVHDAQDFPYPIPDSCCLQVLLSHLWEHIEPKNRIKLMDEIWRVMKPDGQLLISVPYYLSFGAYQDPTHYPCPNEATFTYFDPKYPLYQIYKPKPWKLLRNDYTMNGNMEVIMEAVKGSAKETK